MGPSRTPAAPAHLALIVAFLAGIALPLAAALAPAFSGAPEAPTVSHQEQRRLRRAPALEWRPEALATYPRRFEAFYGDHHGFRATLIAWHSALKVRALGVSPTPRVIIGRDGWLYLGEPSALENYRPPRRFSPANLGHWQRVLEERRDWLAARGIPYLLVIVPEKQSVYPEYLPAAVRRIRGEGVETQLDQLRAHLRAHSNLEVLDLRAPLAQAKAREQVYRKTDTHWSDAGAYAAYEAILQRLGRWFPHRFPQLAPLPRSDFTVAAEPEAAGDLARMMGAGALFAEAAPVLLPQRPRLARPADPGPVRPSAMGRQPARATELDDAALPRAVMFRDSYARALRPFLSEHFRRIVYAWHFGFETAVIERERPDVVIQEFGEGTLRLRRPGNPPGLGPADARRRERPGRVHGPGGAGRASER